MIPRVGQSNLSNVPMQSAASLESADGVNGMQGYGGSAMSMAELQQWLFTHTTAMWNGVANITKDTDKRNSAVEKLNDVKRGLDSGTLDAKGAAAKLHEAAKDLPLGSQEYTQIEAQAKKYDDAIKSQADKEAWAQLVKTNPAAAQKKLIDQGVNPNLAGLMIAGARLTGLYDPTPPVDPNSFKNETTDLCGKLADSVDKINQLAMVQLEQKMSEANTAMTTVSNIIKTVGDMQLAAARNVGG